MPPTRLLPHVGMSARVQGEAADVTVVRVDGPRIVVASGDGAERAFAVHRLTGHWVREGEPYWGLRLTLSAGPD